MAIEKERRKNTRIPLSLSAEVEFNNGEKFHCTTRDISFSGTYLLTNNVICDVTDGSVCKLYLYIGEPDHPVVIEFNGYIVRIEETGLAIRFKFKSTDLDSFDHFKKLMVYNSDDPKKLLQEIEQNPGLFG